MGLDSAEEAVEHKPSWVGIVGRVVLFVVGCAFILAFSGPFLPKLPGMRSEMILGTVATLWALILTFIFARWDGLGVIEVGIIPDTWTVARFAIGFMMGLLIVALWWCALALSGDVRWVPAKGSSALEVWIVLVAFIVLSCREELAFHGYPLHRLKGPFGIGGALLLVALLFAAEHMAGGWPWSEALLGSGTGSLMFGMAAIASRGLALPIGLHAAWNFGHWSIGHKGMPGIWEAVTLEGSEEHAQFVGMAAYLMVMSLGTVILWLWHLRKAT